MASLKPVTGSGRRHARNISHPLPQRGAQGPLEAVDDPLGPSSARSSTETLPAEVAAEFPIFEGANTPQPVQAPVARPVVPAASRALLDLRFLQDRGNYHAIPLEDVAEPFLHSSHQPPPAASLTALIGGGHFRRAAESALEQLLQCPSDDVEQIIDLLHTRLACLVLISRADYASREAAPLTEFLAHHAAGASEVIALVPWELQLLLLRLQTLAGTDGRRRSVMALYVLAGEVRANIRKAELDQDESAVDAWSTKLRDLGLRVADTLVEMGELESATRHLETLTDVKPGEIAYRIALLRLRVGDVNGAQKCVGAIGGGPGTATLSILLDFANGNVSQAVTRARAQSGNTTACALLANNLAVGLLYMGRIGHARDVLERLAKDNAAFAGLLFNLATVYELCSDRAREHKLGLARQMADKSPDVDGGAWERAAFELKL